LSAVDISQGSAARLRAEAVKARLLAQDAEGAQERDELEAMAAMLDREAAAIDGALSQMRGGAPES